MDSISSPRKNVISSTADAISIAPDVENSMSA
jgi:hypothetical protein